MHCFLRSLSLTHTRCRLLFLALKRSLYYRCFVGLYFTRRFALKSTSGLGTAAARQLTDDGFLFYAICSFRPHFATVHNFANFTHAAFTIYGQRVLSAPECVRTVLKLRKKVDKRAKRKVKENVAVCVP